MERTAFQKVGGTHIPIPPNIPRPQRMFAHFARYLLYPFKIRFSVAYAADTLCKQVNVYCARTTV